MQPKNEMLGMLWLPVLKSQDSNHEFRALHGVSDKVTEYACQNMVSTSTQLLSLRISIHARCLLDVLIVALFCLS